MLTPKQLQGLPKPLTDSYSELSEFILRDIARRIAKAAQITDTAQYQMYRARALGLSTDEIAAEIARINGVGEKQIRQLIEQAAKTSDEFDRRMLGKEDSESVLESREQLQKLLKAQIEHTSGQSWNFTRSLGFAERNADGQVIISSLGDFMIDQMDAAHLKVMNGVTDYNTAIRQACNALAESGVRTVYYNSGRSDRIEVAVRRALMTSVSQVTQKISEQNAEEFGADGWEISAHCGARPSHAIYQGRQYPNSRYETIVKPLIEDYNCRHSAYPIIMGLTEPSYTEGELAALDPPPFTYEGRTYTAYEAQQQMRKMERAMRKQKDLCIVADAMGDTDTYTAASIRLRRQKDIYEDFCGAGGVYTEYERTFVAGYNRSLSSKSSWTIRKETTNKAKWSGLFNILPPERGDAITPRKLYNALNKNAIGKEVLDYIIKENISVEINYTNEAPNGLRGYTTGKQIVIYAKNTNSIKNTASTIVHEVIHSKYGIGGNQWAEAHCFAAEYIYLHGDLTFEAKKAIIKEVKLLYPEYQWRRKRHG